MHVFFCVIFTENRLGSDGAKKNGVSQVKDTTIKQMRIISRCSTKTAFNAKVAKLRDRDVTLHMLSSGIGLIINGFHNARDGILLSAMFALTSTPPMVLNGCTKC